MGTACCVVALNIDVVPWSALWTLRSSTLRFSADTTIVPIEMLRSRSARRTPQGHGALLCAMIGVGACSPPSLSPVAARGPIESPRAAVPAPSVVPPPAQQTPEPLKPRDRRELVVLLHHAYRERALGHSDSANLLFKLFVELTSQGGKPELGLGGAKSEIVPARGGVAAIDTPDGPVFFHADTGDPFAFEPDVRLTSEETSRGGQPARGLPLFSVSVVGDEHSYPSDERASSARGRGVAFFDPVTQKLSFQGPLHVYPPRGHLVYAFLFRDCRWHAWDLEKQQEAYALESHVVPAECGENVRGSYLDERAAISSDGRWLIAEGGVWDLATRQRVVRYRGVPVLSPDERFVAHLRMSVEFPVYTGGGVRERNTLVLVDLRSGAVMKTEGPLDKERNNMPYIGGIVMNPDPVWFDPERRSVSVTVYVEAVTFAVPSLRFLSASTPPVPPEVVIAGGAPPPHWPLPEPRPVPVPAAPADPALGERLTRSTCLADGFLVPRAFCMRSETAR